MSTDKPQVFDLSNIVVDDDTDFSEVDINGLAELVETYIENVVEGWHDPQLEYDPSEEGSDAMVLFNLAHRILRAVPFS